MFEGLLKRLLGKYLEGFDEEKLSVNVIICLLNII